MQYLDVLMRSDLFRGIAGGDLETMLGCLSGEFRDYGKNEIILLEGSDVTHVGLVLSGAADVVKEDMWGNRTILTRCEPGDLFAESFSCVMTKKLPVTVISAAESRVLFINYRRIITICPSICSHHLKLIENMMYILASKNILMTEKLQIMAKPTTREKLLAYLYGQSQRCGSLTFMVPFDRQQMADYLGVDRSAMSTELGKLRDEGLISFHKSSFKLHTP